MTKKKWNPNISSQKQMNHSARFFCSVYFDKFILQKKIIGSAFNNQHLFILYLFLPIGDSFYKENTKSKKVTLHIVGANLYMSAKVNKKMNLYIDTKKTFTCKFDSFQGALSFCNIPLPNLLYNKIKKMGVIF